MSQGNHLRKTRKAWSLIVELDVHVEVHEVCEGVATLGVVALVQNQNRKVGDADLFGSDGFHQAHGGHHVDAVTVSHIITNMSKQ